jgi:hypothetical protein
MRFVAVGQGSRFLCAPPPTDLESSVGLSPHVRDVDVVWVRIELPYERIALRTPFGRFLSCQGADGPWLTLSDELGPREAFEEILWPNGEVSFRTSELTYLTADPDDPDDSDDEESLTCRDRSAGPASRFRYSEPPEDVLDVARAVVRRQPRVPDMPHQFAQGDDETLDTSKGDATG